MTKYVACYSTAIFSVKGDRNVKRGFLQIVLVIIGLVLVVTSLLGIIFGAIDEFYGIATANVHLDSNLRFYAGLTLGLGLILLWMVRSIEKQGRILILCSLMIFIGGIGRVVSMIDIGIPSAPFILFTVLELLFPLLVLWQRKIAER